MTRRRRTPKQRLAILEACGEICHICGNKIDGAKERWEIEHIIPLALGGEDGGGNLAPAHVACHREKTSADAGDIAKANRVRAKHNGARPPSQFPGSKGTRWKKKLDGTVVRR